MHDGVLFLCEAAYSVPVLCFITRVEFPVNRYGNISVIKKRHDPKTVPLLSIHPKRMTEALQNNLKSIIFLFGIN